MNDQPLLRDGKDCREYIIQPKDLHNVTGLSNEQNKKNHYFTSILVTFIAT